MQDEEAAFYRKRICEKTNRSVNSVRTGRKPKHTTISIGGNLSGKALIQIMICCLSVNQNINYVLFILSLAKVIIIISPIKYAD